MKITSCPTCGSRRIQKVRRDFEGEFDGGRYKVQALDFYECPACKEQVFDREAMRRIESVSPAFARGH
jgi:YgiT-type zinc finger domain-containing protein